MLKEIRTLVSSSAASDAVTAPTAAASALFSQIAATEYRNQSVEFDDAASDSNARLAEEEAEEAARRSKVEAKLLAEQEAGVAAVVAVAETQKRSLEDELEHAGATVEEKEVSGHPSWTILLMRKPLSCTQSETEIWNRLGSSTLVALGQIIYSALPA